MNAAMKCDFCSTMGVSHVLPVADFNRVGGRIIMHRYTGDWATCPACADLLTSDDWDGLTVRATARIAAKHGLKVTEAMLTNGRQLHALVREHMLGPVRPIGAREGM